MKVLMIFSPQAKDHHVVCGSYVHLAVCDHGSNEFVAWTKLVASSRSLVTVVNLIGEISGIVGVEHGGCSVLCGPYYAVA